jgi:hypothetical protein
MFGKTASKKSKKDRFDLINKTEWKDNHQELTCDQIWLNKMFRKVLSETKPLHILKKDIYFPLLKPGNVLKHADRILDAPSYSPDFKKNLLHCNDQINGVYLKDVYLIKEYSNDVISMPQREDGTSLGFLSDRISIATSSYSNPLSTSYFRIWDIDTAHLKFENINQSFDKVS